jgi:hypothetical protein
MTTKYTPGPWHIHQDLSGAPAVLPTQENGRFAICALYGPQRGHNARLIAAAPELADALAWALDQIEDDLCPDHQEALEHARAVLARAQGVEL